jgi:hypothetical protein
MYIQYNGGNDTSATLKRGGSITWDIWMGAQDDPTVDTSWTQFYVKLLNADGSIMHNNNTGYTVEWRSVYRFGRCTYGWRPLTWDGVISCTHYAYMTTSSRQFDVQEVSTGIVLRVKVNNKTKSKAQRKQ